jgi:hypothetical protein
MKDTADEHYGASTKYVNRRPFRHYFLGFIFIGCCYCSSRTRIFYVHYYWTFLMFIKLQ